jgi:hypothetical protein
VSSSIGTARASAHILDQYVNFSMDLVVFGTKNQGQLLYFSPKH